MGWSGNSGKVAMGVQTRNISTGAYTSGGASQYVLEVVSWEYEERVRVTGYSHSESAGSEDVVGGTWSASGTVEVKLDKGQALTWGAGQVVDMTLYNAVIILNGLAILEAIPISTRIDGGEPVSSTYRWRSKLGWTATDGDGIDYNT